MSPQTTVLDAVEAALPAAYERLAALVRVPSVTGSDAEHDLVAQLAADLRADGLEVDHWALSLDKLLADPDFPGLEAPRDEGWGLVARLPGRDPDAPTLMLNGHVDVVPPGDRGAWSMDPYAGTLAGGDLYGRGACDMKGGLVAALTAVRALVAAGVRLRGDLLVACVQGEEDGGLGTFATLRRGWRADACVVPEPTGLDLITANAGALTFRLLVPGRATHASRRSEGVSAIEKFVPVLRALTALEARRNAAVDPLMRRWPIAYPLSIGTVHAGDWASTVPDLLVAEGRLGVALDEPVAEARQALEDAVAEACAGDRWLREHPVRVEWWGGQFASGRCPASSDLAERVRAAHTVVHGTAPDTYGGPYGSDLRLLTAAGIPTVHYGPGESALAHAPDERVPLAEVGTTARALAALAVDICGA
jgi:acetylornithine deacetylase